MKKLLAALLAGLMLCGFAVHAGAQTSKELIQTMKDLAGDYTITGRLSYRETRRDYAGAAHSGGAYAFLREDGVRDIHFADRTVRVYPERNAYHKLSSSYSFNYLPLLLPKEIASAAARKWYESTELSFDGYSYWYKNGCLWSINDNSFDIAINKFDKRADPGIFSLEGMREAPEFMKWVWEPKDAFDIFLSEHPVFGTAYGKALSAVITALAIVGMPLIYLVIVVLRILFYFDLYKI